MTLEFFGVILDSGKMALSLLKEETPQSTKALPGNPRKEESNSQGTK